jgi:hypothetical protein
VDFLSKQWTCPFCLTRNIFPPHYAENITETNLPAELIPQFTTLEYQLPGKYAGPPAFLYVVDLGLQDDDLDQLKDSILQSLSLLPPSALVGLVTYGTNVAVHELGGGATTVDCPRSFVFKGTKDYETNVVQTLLGLAPGGGAYAGAGGGGAQPSPGANRFLAPVAEAGFVVEHILEDLQRDPWPRAADTRPARAIGPALSIATSLLERTVGKAGARVMLFMGGPATVGPGAVVGRPLAETMRSHSDLQKDSAPLYKPAAAFYKGVAARAAANGHSIDVFACSLDQVGLLELRSCVASTGGLCVLADTFSQSVFKESFRRVFRRFEDSAPAPDAGHLTMGFAATLECLTSRDYKISGAIGPCVSLKKGSPSVSETEIGEGGTYAWSLGGIDPSTSLSLYFDVAAKDAASAQPGKRHHLQLITYYQHSSGRYRMRVTTTAGLWNSGDPASLPSLAASFDQETAAVMMARVAVNRTETEEPADILRWLDRSLIRLCAKFAEYRKDDPSSFRLAPNFSLFPQFMFHLRRSQFMQVRARGREGGVRRGGAAPPAGVLSSPQSPPPRRLHALSLLAPRADVWHVARRERLQPHDLLPRGRVQQPRHDPAVAHLLLVPGAAAPGAAGRDQVRAGGGWLRKELAGGSRHAGPAHPTALTSPALVASLPPRPAHPRSVRPDVMLLLDTFFHVLIFHGETIANWRDQGFADLPEHAAFRQLLEAPKEDAASIMEKRFPVPRYIVCDQLKSQARFLMAKLNPSVTHNTMDVSGVAPVFTDDVSYSVFSEHLCKLAVAS